MRKALVAALLLAVSTSVVSQHSPSTLVVVPTMENQATLGATVGAAGDSKPMAIDLLYESGLVTSPNPADQPSADAAQALGLQFFDHPEHDKLSVVEPEDGSEPFTVSTSFLQMVLRIPVDSERRIHLLSQYDQIAADQFESMMQTMYPDASTNDAYPVALESMLFEADSRASALIEQDPYAAPYARVSIETADGQRTDFSISRKQINSLLANDHLSAAGLIQALTDTKHRLGENVRYRFNNLSAEDLAAFVRDRPELDSTDFVAFNRLTAPGDAINTPQAGESATQIVSKGNEKRPKPDLVLRARQAVPERNPQHDNPSLSAALVVDEATVPKAEKLNSASPRNVATPLTLGLILVVSVVLVSLLYRVTKTPQMT